jgi:hypothetical protein
MFVSFFATQQVADCGHRGSPVENKGQKRRSGKREKIVDVPSAGIKSMDKDKVSKKINAVFTKIEKNQVKQIKIDLLALVFTI